MQLVKLSARAKSHPIPTNHRFSRVINQNRQEGRNTANPPKLLKISCPIGQKNSSQFKLFFFSAENKLKMSISNKSSSLIFRRFLHQNPTIPNYRKTIIHPIVRVDHAGELAADRIYAGQLAMLPKNHRLVPIIEQMWKEEKRHLDEMERQLAKYEVRPTMLAPICSIAGFLLGAGTAAMGEKAAMACTIAVEEVIGQHYNDQIKLLMEDNAEGNKELMDLLQKLRDDEMEHHDTGVKYEGMEAPFYGALKSIIQTGCKTAIWITQRI